MSLERQPGNRMGPTGNISGGSLEHIYIHICRPGERQFWRMFLGNQTGLWYLGTGNPEIQTIGSWAETPRLRHLGLGI